MFIADEKFLGTKDTKSCGVSIYEVRDRRSTDDISMRSGIKIAKNWAQNGDLGTPKLRGDEGECVEVSLR